MTERILTKEVSPPLNRLLATHRVECFQPRERMLQLNSVPAGERFSKRRTNVLLREQTAGGAWLVYVDEDLKYRGDDVARQSLFGGPARRGWLPLVVPQPLRGDVNQAIVWTLEQLESGVRAMVPEETTLLSPSSDEAPPPLDSVVRRVGRRLSGDELPAATFATESQVDAIAQIAATVLRSAAPRCPLVIGPAGTGKTAVARAAAAELLRRGLVEEVLELQGAAVSAGAIFWPERDERLRQTLEALLMRSRPLAILEQVDLALTKSETAAALLADAIDRGLRLITVARPGFSLRHVRSAALLRRLEPVRVGPPEEGELTEILARLWADHPLAAEVELSPDVLPLVAALSKRRPGGNPGAAIGLHEAVAASAAFGGRRCAGPDDVYHYAGHGHASEGQAGKRAE